MKICELSKDINVTNKELIEFLRGKGYKVSSHTQTLTDEMIEAVRSGFAKEPEKKAADEKPAVKSSTVTASETKKAKKVVPEKVVKRFDMDELVPCTSLTPWYMDMAGADKKTIYKWPGYGDVQYVPYRDLQSWRQKDIVKNGMIMIEDPDICEQWKNDLKNAYANYAGIEYPEEFFDKSDDEFRRMLETSSETFKEVIKYTAYDMIRNENYPSLRKINIIDEVLKTQLKDFI